MGRQDVSGEFEPEAIRAFTKALLTDLRALEHIIESGRIESGCRRFGAEQELFLVNQTWRPAPIALEVLADLNDPAYTTELAQFNLEINLDPMNLGGACFSALEERLNEMVSNVRIAAQKRDCDVVLTGILPTLSKSDLSLDNITPKPRYFALNEAITRMRGGPMRLLIEGTDELHIEHDSVMLESCNTSFQVHLQVTADEFARFYNIAQAIAAPILAMAANSPLLFGKRLWKETRIALFQQSVDTRSATPHLRELSPRVRFGEKWLEHSAIEAFQEDVARFRVLMTTEVDEDPFEVLESGKVPELKALQMHNSTVYRWNRPCYGVGGNQPHLRIECRLLPAGPSIVDEVANAAFWIGLMIGAAAKCGDVTQKLSFDDAKANFLAAARHGLRAEFTWFDGVSYHAPDLVLDHLVPIACEGLKSAGVDDDDIKRYLGIIRHRVASRRTGAKWLLTSLKEMPKKNTWGERGAALTAAIFDRQFSQKKPVHEWDLARLEESGGWKPGYVRVEQFMTTDLFTVGEDELVDYAAFLMDQRRLRHVLVEDHDHRLVGIVSYRSLIRLIAHDGVAKDRSTLPVAAIMEREPVTVSPETPSVEAIQIMRKNRVSALPVLKNEKLVGMVTEQNFIDLAGDLLEGKLKEP